MVQCLIDRNKIVEIARSWIGTPYHHQASLKGVGCDCIGLVRGIIREYYGTEPPIKINYSPDWGDSNGNEDIIQAGFAYLLPVENAKIGDVLAVRWRRGLVAKHVMVLSGPNQAIHAINGAPVSEITLSDWWLSKVAHSFQFPEEITWQL